MKHILSAFTVRKSNDCFGFPLAPMGNICRDKGKKISITRKRWSVVESFSLSCETTSDAILHMIRNSKKSRFSRRVRITKKAALQCNDNYDDKIEKMTRKILFGGIFRLRKRLLFLIKTSRGLN